jgi:2-polyprenyl-6-methoxyphenol hydroxylase-like FAD-dependent oxidoreductase
MSKLNVLVVGASIAGPTTAYWLAKAGATVTVIERFPQLRTSGQNVDIRTSGVSVMRKMPGMEAAVRAKKAPIEGFSWVGDDGTVFASMRPSGDPDHQSLVSEYEIFRGDLAKILYDLTVDNESIKYVFGEQVTALKQKEDGPVVVEFMNGYPTQEYDLVVAADGSTSRTRALGLGCGVRDHVVPLNTWCSFFTVKGDMLKGSKMGQSWSTVGGRWLAIGGDAEADVSRILAWSIHPRNNPDAMASFREAYKEGDDAMKRCVAERFGGIGWRSDEIIERMGDSVDFYSSEMVQVKVPCLYKGRFAMVGDAGCGGAAGAGTTLALAGAYILAGEILSHKDDLAAGLKGYEERMRPMITEMQKLPPGFPNFLAPQTRWRIQLRNMVIRIVCWSAPVLKWAGSWLSGALAKERVPLPEYQWLK